MAHYHLGLEWLVVVDEDMAQDIRWDKDMGRTSCHKRWGWHLEAELGRHFYLLPVQLHWSLEKTGPMVQKGHIEQEEVKVLGSMAEVAGHLAEVGLELGLELLQDEGTSTENQIGSRGSSGKESSWLFL